MGRRKGGALRSFLVLLLAGGAGCGDETTAPPAAPEPEAKRAESAVAAGGTVLLVKFRDGTAGTAIDARLAPLAQKVRKYSRSNRKKDRPGPAFFETLVSVQLDAAQDPDEALLQLRSAPDVEYAHPEALYHAVGVPSDPSYPQLWGLQKIQADLAWDAEVGRHEVVVAVIDTGIDVSHPDLRANVWVNPDEIPANGVDDDGNGYADDLYGYDFANADPEPFDDHDHGTHVAGTIGAVGNNGIGVVGVAWKVKLMAVKFLRADGSGTESDAVAAIQYAALNGAHVLSNSWGGPSYSQAIQDAVTAANTAGALVVAAAGNDNTDAPFYPAAMSGVVSVAATDTADQKASFSNFGPQIDLAAPGVDILSTVRSSGYARFNGTSMACPHVSGLAALLKSRRFELTNADLEAALRSSADDLGEPGRDDVFGDGRINAYRAISTTPAGAPRPISEIAHPLPREGVSASFEVAGTAAGDAFQSYLLEAVSPGGSAWTTVSAGSAPVTQAVLGTVDVSGWPQGWAGIRLRVDAPGGVTVTTASTVRYGIGPPPPSPVFPADGSTSHDPRPIFDWSDSSDPDGIAYYELQVDNNSDFSSPELSVTNLPFSQFYPDDPLPDGWYSWRTRAIDGLGNAGAWSVVWTLRINTAPRAPVLSAPANGSGTIFRRPTFMWQPVGDPDGVTYRIHVDNDSDFSSLTFEGVTTSTSFQAPFDLAEAVYRWRVRGEDGTGRIGDWSEVWTVAVDPTPPPNAQLLSPADNASLNDSTPTMDWQDVTDTSGVVYEFTLRNITTGTDIVKILNHPVSEYTVTSPLGEAQYSWSVISKNGAGLKGLPGSSRTFRIDLTPPPPSAPSSPADGTVTADSTPTLTAASVSDASGVNYHFQIDDNADFSSPERDAVSGTTSFTPSSALPDGTYSWRVRSEDRAGNVADWSAAWRIMIDATPPPIPSPVSPADGSSISNRTPLLDWSDVSDPNGVKYTVQLDDSSTFSSPNLSVSNLTESQRQVTTSLAEGVWWWRVRATDNLGNQSAWGGPWSFRVDVTPPPAPSLVSPLLVDATTDTTPTFVWSAVSDPSGATYQFQLAKLNLLQPFSAGSLVYDVPGLAVTTFTVPQDLELMEYEWRVRAIDGAANVGAWSQVRRLTVVPPP